MPLYVVAEKILGARRGASRRLSWAIAGTTGIRLSLAAANGALGRSLAAAERLFDEIHQSCTGRMGRALRAPRSIRTSKQAIPCEAPSPAEKAVQMLTHVLKRIADGRRRARDFTLTSLLRAVEETLLAFPVYRSYVRPDGTRRARDEELVTTAIDAARHRNPLVDSSVFDFLRSVLLLEDRSGGKASAFTDALPTQLTGPVDGQRGSRTPSCIAIASTSSRTTRSAAIRIASPLPPAELHAHNVARLARWPLGQDGDDDA